MSHNWTSLFSFLGLLVGSLILSKQCRSDETLRSAMSGLGMHCLAMLHKKDSTLMGYIGYRGVCWGLWHLSKYAPYRCRAQMQRCPLFIHTSNICDKCQFRGQALVSQTDFSIWFNLIL